jgi:hypothetical protein
MARSVPGTLDRRDPRDLSLGTGIYVQYVYSTALNNLLERHQTLNVVFTGD